MRILLFDAEDSPRRGPWCAQQWDLIVDLGKSSEFSAAEWTRQSQCSILLTDSFRQGIADIKLVREIFALGRGRLLDDEGIDWWDLTSLVILPEAEMVLTFRRLTAEINQEAEVWATRRSWAANVIEILLRRPIQFFSDGFSKNLSAKVRHYRNVLSRFSAAKIKEIIFDRYDSGYKWRSRLSPHHSRLAHPVILLPSAYGNVSRMAAAYAAMLPEQSFLLIATRQSAKRFIPPPNVLVRDLASYARASAANREASKILEGWTRLRTELRTNADLDVLAQSGAMDRLPGWFRDGLSARNAWREVMEREPVSGVLCGDDSNIFTRLPVLLAARRKIPTVDFHHGAMDGRYLLKDVPCDVYLAKNDMERDYLLHTCKLPQEKIEIGAPAQPGPDLLEVKSRKDSIVLFSEPYEAVGMRGEEVYRELLPALCHLARQTGHSVVIKLHPFESVSVREKIINVILSSQDRQLVSIVEGPLSEQLLSHAWCGITIESTTVVDCLMRGIPCFLCGWLTLSPFEYAQQYLRFGIGENLHHVNDVAEIPRKIANFDDRLVKRTALWKTAEPALLRQWLTSTLRTDTAVRRVS